MKELMTAGEMVANEIVTFADVKGLAAAAGPCLTIVVPIPAPHELPVRLKNAAHVVEKRLKDRGSDAATIESVMQPVHELARTVETAGIWGNALVLYRSPGLFRYFLQHRQDAELATVEERFQVGPLLAALAREQRFHLLGLSHRRVRLLQCTQHRWEQEGLRGLVPEDMTAWLDNRKPEHVLENRSAAGPSTGSMKGVLFGTGGREREDEHLAQFFQAVDEGVNALLPGGAEPLLLAGVERDVAVYRHVSVYPRLFRKAVHGSPDRFSDAELHRRAVEVVMQEPLRGAGTCPRAGGKAARPAGRPLGRA